MDIKTVLDKSRITHDTKSRRVLNTAPDKHAGITLDELESGVTIERLESLDVPVYRYATQITIHGVFSDLQNNYVLGYKSLIVNGNHSLGVKYTAIDGGKKVLLADVAVYNKDKDKWYIHRDSSGCQAIRTFSDKNELLECYNKTPDDLYIGSKRAVALMYGGYAVIIDIGIIYQRHLWGLIIALTGINETEYNRLKAVKKSEDAQWRIEFQAKQERNRTEIQAQIDTAKQNFIPPTSWIPFSGEITKPGIYAKVGMTINGVGLFVVQAKKRGARLCRASRLFKDFQYEPWNPEQYKAFASTKFEGWEVI